MYRSTFQRLTAKCIQIFGTLWLAFLMMACGATIARGDEPAAPSVSATDLEATIQRVLVAELDRRFPPKTPPLPLTANEVETIVRKVLVAELDSRFPSSSTATAANAARRSAPPKPTKVVVHAPEWSAADFERFKKAAAANKHIAAVRGSESLKDLALAQDEVLLLVLSPAAFEKIGEYDRPTLRGSRKIGVGYGAARLFGELGHELNWEKCAHGTSGAPRAAVEANGTIDAKAYTSPFFIFEPHVLDATDAHNKHIFGVYLGSRFGEQLDVIAKIPTDANYALVSRQEKNVLVGIDAQLESWSDRTVQLVVELIPGLN